MAVLERIAPQKVHPVVIHCTPPQALEHLLDYTDKVFGRAWDIVPKPSDSIETIMYRAGAADFRSNLEKSLHATRKQILTK